MKNIILFALTAAMTIGLTACPGKSSNGPGDTFVTSPNSCFNYKYVAPTPGVPGAPGMPGTVPPNPGMPGTPGNGYYVDPQTGARVNCNPGYYQNGYFAPYAGMNDCASWSMYYPDSYYVPMYVTGYGMMCVKSSYFQTLPGWNNYYQTYGAYPTYTQNCRPGVNCPVGCFGAGGGAPVGGAGAWLGGTLSLCI